MESSAKTEILNRIRRLLRWALVSLGGTDSDTYPIQQIRYSGKAGDAVVWLPYGIHANIPAEYPSLLALMQGNSEARVILPGSPEQRPKPLAVGEIAVYHPQTGTIVHFKSNSDLEVTTSTKVVINTGGDTEINATGDVNVTAGGNMALVATGNIAITAGGSLTASAGGSPVLTGDGAGNVALDAASGDVDITASGDVNVGGTGNTVITGNTFIEGKDFLNHQHSGVQSGASNTGGVV